MSIRQRASEIAPAGPRDVAPGTPDVDICVVSFNARDHLRTCLDSVRDQGASQVVVVENASEDGSLEMLRAEFPWVRIIENDRNVGYATAANQAIEATHSPTVLLLNCDTILPPAALPRLDAYRRRHPEAAVIGPRLRSLDGSIQPSCYSEPTPVQLLLEASMLGRIMPRVPVLRRLSVRWWPHDRARRVDWLLGAALLIDRAAFEAAGRFDESFPLYYEEVDLCARLRALGREIHFAPVADVAHVGGGSSVAARDVAMLRWFAGTRIYYRKHYGPVRRLQLEVFMRCLAGARLLRDVLAWPFASPDRRDGLGEMMAVWSGVLLGRHGDPER
jgi:hypothetical protein